MSDSEDDIFPNNVFTFQNENTTICARGRDINKSNMTGLSFRSNVLTSTLNMPGNAQRQRFANPQYDQRSFYHRRETSPMSMRSDLGPRNFHNSYYARAISSQRSLINGRSGSPVSVRSIDTTASVSAVDIANAFKYMKFNNHELRIIKDAYQKLMRNKTRKRIEKRRNLKLFLRGVRRKSGYDSGEQGSDSSLSSDDGRSVKTTMSYKSGIPRQQLNKIDESLLRTSIKETDIYNDCTDIIKQNTLRNIFPVPLKPINREKPSHIENPIEVQKETENPNGTMTLKDRFTKGFLLPSQRFNKSQPNVSLDKFKNGSILPKTTEQVLQSRTQIINTQIESEEEQIFPDKTIRGNGNLNLDLQKKRFLDDDDSAKERKRSKIDTNHEQCGKRSEENNSDFDDNDFMFKKPSMPVRKSNKTRKDDVTEVLISKSSQPLTQKTNNPSDDNHQTVQELGSENNQTVISQNSSDVSMKPSFIKRKLFTQKLDLLDRKNGDNLAAQSPQTKSNACKEKNKTRKLVTSQSCLSRDVVDDDNNVLDLIHKIIPAEQMNLTTASSKRSNKNNNVNVPDDKWDVASVVSLCNSADGSDTYTDEEIFNYVNNTIKKKGDNKKEVREVNQTGKAVTKECKVVLQNVTCEKIYTVKESLSTKMTTLNKGAVSNSVKSFWDTDLESDIEGHSAPAWKQKTSANQVKETVQDPPNITTNVTTLQPEKKRGKGSMLTVRGLKNKTNNKTILSDVKKKPSTSPHKAEISKESDTVKSKTVTNKKPPKQAKKTCNKQIDIMLNTSTRSTRNSKKNLDCSCCDSVPNGNNTQPNKTKKTNNKTTKTVKPKASQKKSTPKEIKSVSKITVQTRKNRELQSVLNNTQESDSSINISSRSLRSMKRLENSKENIEPKRTRSWCKNTSVC